MTVPGWPMFELGELCDIASGGTPARREPSYFDGDVPWVKIGDMLRDPVASTEECISTEGLSASSAKVFPAGTLLLSIFATIGRTAVLAVPAATNQAIAGISPRNAEALSVGFLRRFLDYSVAGLQSQSRGVAQANINLSILRRLPVALPPIEEQRRIAAILGKADELRAKRRAALAHLDSLTQSMFLDMFDDPGTNPRGWPTRSIRSLATSAVYGTSEKASDAGPVAVLRMGNISSTGRIHLNNLKYMELSDKEVDRYTVRRGDILFNRTNSADLVGKTAVYRGDVPMAFAGYLVRLRLASDADPEYLGALLNSQWAKTTLRAMCKSIVGMANINANELQNIVVTVPPIDLQRKFADITRAVLAREGIHKSALGCHDELFASLQHRAFSGAL